MHKRIEKLLTVLFTEQIISRSAIYANNESNVSSTNGTPDATALLGLRKSAIEDVKKEGV